LILFILAAENYTLVDFVDKQCVGVVPLQCILCCYIKELNRGDDLNVLWDDNWEYFARFIITGLSDTMYSAQQCAAYCM